MSQWTHVNGCIRLDGMPGFPEHSKSRLVAVLGQTVRYDDDEDKWEGCTVPMGSEGSIQYDIIENPSGNALSRYAVIIWGDLRDYEEVEKIATWFGEIINQWKMVRSAILEIDVEGKGAIILRTYHDEQCTLVVERIQCRNLY